ncbi:MAG: hypothetical protein RR880_04250 [Bacteroidales bacterium]
MSYDVYPYSLTPQKSKDEFAKTAIKGLLERNHISKGDLIGIIGGNYTDDSEATFMEIIAVR